MRARCNFAVVAMPILLLLAGCVSQPSYEDAFSTKQQVPGSVETLPVSVDVAWGALLEVISRQGFLVQQAVYVKKRDKHYNGFCLAQPNLITEFIAGSSLQLDRIGIFILFKRVCGVVLV